MCGCALEVAGVDVSVSELRSSEGKSTLYNQIEYVGDPEAFDWVLPED